MANSDDFKLNFPFLYFLKNMIFQLQNKLLAFVVHSSLFLYLDDDPPQVSFIMNVSTV